MLNLCMLTEPVTTGADAAVYVQCTVLKPDIFLGQCVAIKELLQQN